MQIKELSRKIKESIGKGAVLSVQEDGFFPFLELSSDHFKQTMRYCRTETSISLDFLECITGVDEEEGLWLLYRFFSTEKSYYIDFKVKLDRYKFSIPSVSDIWRSAFHLEKECAEMFGFVFEGNDFQGPLLLSEGWQGYPLRKDYAFPEQFGGIDHRRERNRG